MIALFLAALMASSVSAQSVGSANVINQCSSPVYLSAVPSVGSIEATVLAPGQSWGQGYTELSNGAGWSIKMSMDDSLTQVLQYEYTFQNNGIINYDLSQINGDPFNGNWYFSGSDGCSPSQNTYTVPTSPGAMQTCPQAASVTLTLCPSGQTSNVTKKAVPFRA